MDDDVRTLYGRHSKALFLTGPLKNLLKIWLSKILITLSPKIKLFTYSHKSADFISNEQRIK